MNTKRNRGFFVNDHHANALALAGERFQSQIHKTAPVDGSGSHRDHPPARSICYGKQSACTSMNGWFSAAAEPARLRAPTG
jgi:hypothetical protein